MPVAIPLIIAGAAALAKTGFSLAQHAAAEKDDANNKLPPYNIPQEWFNNDNLAAAQAQYGLSVPSQDYYTDQASRGLSSGLDAVLKGGGNVNTVADLMDTYDTGLNKIASEDNELRNANLDRYIQANGNLGNERDKAYAINEYEPYKNRKIADTAKEGVSMQNAMSGLDDLTNVASAASVSGNKYEATHTGGAPVSISPNQSASFAQFGGNPGDSFAQFQTGPADVSSFNTTGGYDTLMNMFKQNPNSPYIQNLLRTVNASKIQ